MTNRVSKASVMVALDKFVDRTLLWKIMDEIENENEREEARVLNMTYGEWKERFDDDHKIVWAADTEAGMGNAGDSCYGDCDDCTIKMITRGNGELVLHLWDDRVSSYMMAKKPFKIKGDGMELKRSYSCGSYSYAVDDAFSKGFTKFSLFRWGGKRSDGEDIWDFVGKYEKKD